MGRFFSSYEKENNSWRPGWREDDLKFLINNISWFLGLDLSDALFLINLINGPICYCTLPNQHIILNVNNDFVDNGN